MRLFGDISELGAVVLREDGQAITIDANQSTTYTGSRTFQLSPGDASQVLVSESATQTLSAKTLDNTTTLTIKDTLLTLQDDGDVTKQAKFQLSGISAGTTRTFTFPDANATLLGESSTQNVQNKTLDNTNTITVKDTLLTIQDDGDTTKQLKFQASGITASTTRTLTAPDANTTIVGTDAAQVITNKDIDGGTASNTLRLTLPKNTTTNLNALTRKEATLVYDTTTGAVKFDNGSTLTALAAASTATPTVAGNVTSYVPTIQSNIKILAGDYTVQTTDGFEIIEDPTNGAPTTITLPTASSNVGRTITVKKTANTGTTAVVVASSGTIDGATSNTFSQVQNYATYYSNGTEWKVRDVYQYRSSGATTTSATAGSPTTIASVLLYPGLWEINFVCNATANAGFTAVSFWIDTTANSSGGIAVGDNFFTVPASITFDTTGVVSGYQVLVTTNTTFYLNAQRSGSTGNCRGRITASRWG